MLSEQINKVTDYTHACSIIGENITDAEIAKKMLYSISKIYLNLNLKCPDVITIRKYKAYDKNTEGFVVFLQYGEYLLQYQKRTSYRTNIITIKTRTRNEEATIDKYKVMTGLFIQILKESLKV